MQHMQAVNFIHLSSTIISIGNSIFGPVSVICERIALYSSAGTLYRPFRSVK